MPRTLDVTQAAMLRDECSALRVERDALIKQVASIGGHLDSIEWLTLDLASKRLARKPTYVVSSAHSILQRIKYAKNIIAKMSGETDA